jgi:two-component system, chemotaxis family, response regulator Rcp1
MAHTLDIVLVEDNSADVFLIKRALQEAGLTFSLRTFKDGEEALKFVEAAEETSAAPDIFLMDWNLPRVHGKEILRAIRHSGLLSKTPRVVLTSSDSPVDRTDVEGLGGVFVSKPRSLEEFMQIGRRVKSILEVE